MKQDIIKKTTFILIMAPPPPHTNIASSLYIFLSTCTRVWGGGGWMKIKRQHKECGLLIFFLFQAAHSDLEEGFFFRKRDDWNKGVGVVTGKLMGGGGGYLNICRGKRVGFLCKKSVVLRRGICLRRMKGSVRIGGDCWEKMRGCCWRMRGWSWSCWRMRSFWWRMRGCCRRMRGCCWSCWRMRSFWFRMRGCCRRMRGCCWRMRGCCGRMRGCCWRMRGCWEVRTDKRFVHKKDDILWKSKIFLWKDEGFSLKEWRWLRNVEGLLWEDGIVI